jgi:predicted esterase
VSKPKVVSLFELGRFKLTPVLISVLIIFSLQMFDCPVSKAQALTPYKDDLFSNTDRKVIEAKNNNSFKRYRWDEMEDVNGRDAVPGITAKPERVDLAPLSQQRDITVKYPGGQIETVEVGTPKDAKFAVLFIHGADGTSALGASDTSFGGNFNRIKNLATRNGGVYYSPTVSFDKDGSRGVQEIINQIKKNSPKAKIVISCASAGAYTCWQMANNPDIVDKLSGVILLGGAETDPNLGNSPGYVSKLPIILSHGSNDKLVPWQMVNEEYETIHKQDPNYPLRFELYDGGKHGTPMRNFDWKESLQWIFAQNRPTSDSAPAKGRSTTPLKTDGTTHTRSIN